MKKRFFFVPALLFLIFPSSVHACRLWVAVATQVPNEIIQHDLAQAKDSLKQLGYRYQDGWSVGYYEKGEPIIFRGVWPANIDQYFDRAVHDVSGMNASIVFAHLRRATSGCVKGVLDPHPFERIKGGKNWIFAHNGGMEKKILIDLIGQAYLDQNKPEVCKEDPPDSWIDSELYFIFLLKHIEAQAFDVEKGIRAAYEQLSKAIPEKERFFNFYLSDGATVWVLRKGNDLFYRKDENGPVMISSTIPDLAQEGWVLFPEDTLAVIQPAQEIRFLPFRETVPSFSK